MSQAFSAAAYRFGHSLVQEEFLRLSQHSFEHKCNNDSKSEFYPIPVKDFGNPTYLYEKCNGGVDSIFRGLVKSPAAKVDGWVGDEFLIEHPFTYLLPGKSEPIDTFSSEGGREELLGERGKVVVVRKPKQLISRNIERNIILPKYFWFKLFTSRNLNSVLEYLLEKYFLSGNLEWNVTAKK